MLGPYSPLLRVVSPGCPAWEGKLGRFRAPDGQCFAFSPRPGLLEPLPALGGQADEEDREAREEGPAPRGSTTRPPSWWRGRGWA